jgi:hypothetical protein
LTRYILMFKQIFSFLLLFINYVWYIEVMRYKPEGCGLNSSWGSLRLLIIFIIPAALCPWNQFSLWQK